MILCSLYCPKKNPKYVRKDTHKMVRLRVLPSWRGEEVRDRTPPHCGRKEERRRWRRRLHRRLRPSRRHRSKTGNRSPTSRRMSSGRCWSPETPPFRLLVLSTRTPPPIFALSRYFFLFVYLPRLFLIGWASILRSGSCHFFDFGNFWRRHPNPYASRWIGFMAKSTHGHC